MTFVGGSLTAGYIDSNIPEGSERIKLREKFLEGQSTSISAGFGLTAGITSSIVDDKKVNAYEFGISSPQIGMDLTSSFEANLGGNGLSKWHNDISINNTQKQSIGIC